MKKIIRLTESDLFKLFNKIINEQNDTNEFSKEDNLEDIIDTLNKASSKVYVHHNEEDYGLDKDMFKWYRRRYGFFNIYLAENVLSFKTGEFEWLKNHNKRSFIDFILIYTLLDFFYKVSGEEFEVEDFQRNGRQEGWLYFVRDVYGDELGKIYDESIDS